MFFLRRLMERKVFSMLIILIERWQVLSYLISLHKISRFSKLRQMLEQSIGA